MITQLRIEKDKLIKLAGREGTALSPAAAHKIVFIGKLCVSKQDCNVFNNRLLLVRDWFCFLLYHCIFR
jgi:hypothetical protein